MEALAYLYTAIAHESFLLKGAEKDRSAQDSSFQSSWRDRGDLGAEATGGTKLPCVAITF